MNITKLSSKLKEHFAFHLSRMKCLSYLIFALIDFKSVSLSRLAQKVPADSIDSAYKRLQRFIKQVRFPSNKLAHLILAFSRIDKAIPFRLIFDRTNWKLGSKHINILFLSVACERLAIPLFFTFLKDKKSGNSNQQDRITLLQKFIKTFGKKKIEVILGDREFIGFQWLAYLVREKIDFCVRLKEGWQKVSTSTGQMVEVKKCFKGLKKGQVKCLGVRKLGVGKNAVYCSITGMRNEKEAWVIVAHSENLSEPCELYRDRWQIETMFRVMKTGGFNLEDTHVTEPERLECLIGIVSMAYALCYHLGKWAAQKEPQKPKKHGYFPKTIIKRGMEAFSRAIALITIKPSYFRQLMRIAFSNIRLSKKSFVL